jgi:hypothetical protein
LLVLVAVEIQAVEVVEQVVIKLELHHLLQQYPTQLQSVLVAMARYLLVLLVEEQMVVILF